MLVISLYFPSWCINYSIWNSTTSFKTSNHSHVVTLGTAAPLYQCSARWWHMMDFRALLFPSPHRRDCSGMLAGPWQARPLPWLTLINIQRCPLNPSSAVTTRTVLSFSYHTGGCSWWWWWKWLWCSWGLKHEQRIFKRFVFTAFLINKRIDAVIGQRHQAG